MAYFQTKNPNLGKLWRAFEWKILVHLMPISNILRPFGNFTKLHTTKFGIFVLILYIFPRFGILCQEKSGNPARFIQHGQKKNLE
jgi:hypothetical protein